jgi:hypothetical protein
VAERRMSSSQRSFSEALRESKAKRKEQKIRRSSCKEDDSIVSRLLREKSIKNTSDKKQIEESPIERVVQDVLVKKVVIKEAATIMEMSSSDNTANVVKSSSQNPCILESGQNLDQNIGHSEAVNIDQDMKPSVRCARERTESECSDTMPDLFDPIAAEEEEMKKIEEMKKELEDMKHVEIKKTPENKGGSDGKPDITSEVAPNNNEDHEMTPIFMTNLDDEESDADVSSADVTENLTDDRLESNLVEPQVRTMVEKLFSQIMDNKCTEETPNIQKDTFPGDIERFINQLVSNILDLVLNLANKPTTEKALKNAGRVEKQMANLELESEDESEISECESVHDMFDLSMKRLNFIESSFKTMSGSTLDLRSITPDIQAITTSHEEVTRDRELGARTTLERIKEVLASEKGLEEKLKEIGELVHAEENRNCLQHATDC